MADVLCPRCGAPLESQELWLTDTAVAFPALGRELTPTGPGRGCLDVRSCSAEGIQYARWHDRPNEQFRPIDTDTLRWID
jgi:hypothetical protein